MSNYIEQKQTELLKNTWFEAYPIYDGIDVLGEVERIIATTIQDTLARVAEANGTEIGVMFYECGAEGRHWHNKHHKQIHEALLELGMKN